MNKELFNFQITGTHILKLALLLFGIILIFFAYKEFIRDVERVRPFMAERAEELIQVQYLGALLRNGSCPLAVIPRQLCCEEPLFLEFSF